MTKHDDVRERKCNELITQMPSSYRACYKKAIGGKSLRASVNSFCLECVCWRIEEIRNCTDLSCPLFAVRPYQIPQNGHDKAFSGEESKNSTKGISSSGKDIKVQMEDENNV